jgi:hypothetical protein
MIEFPDPRTLPSKMDQLVAGVDCARHPLITTCIISQNGTPPEQQVRNHLLSLRQATLQDVFPRNKALDLTEDEFRILWKKLELWEKSNSVAMPPQTDCADHPRRRK